MYHYTDINALSNIITNRELWLTHASFLNDHTEGQELFTLLTEIFQSEPNIIKLLKFVDKTSEAYCLSFSQDKDLLSQWRGYCPGVGGYNIAINDNIFELPLKIIDRKKKRFTYHKILRKYLIHRLMIY